MASYQIKNFEWVRGTTPRLVFIFRTRTGGTDDAPIFTPKTFDDARFTMYKGRKGGEMICRYSVVSGEITPDPATGQISFPMLAVDTRALNETQPGEDGKNRYEIELRNGMDERVYILGVIAGVGGINDDEQDDDAGNGGN